jgi:hypothetical protein
MGFLLCKNDYFLKARIDKFNHGEHGEGFSDNTTSHCEPMGHAYKNKIVLTAWQSLAT